MKLQPLLLLFALAAAPAMADPVYPAYKSPSVYEWLDHPDKRDPALHLAFVEIIAIAGERHTLTNGVLSFKDKRWDSLLKVRSGVATLKLIESPGVQMPHTLDAHFESWAVVPRQDPRWADQKVVPARRFLAFLRKQQENEWVVDSPGFIDPVTCLCGDRAAELQSLFKTQLATADSVEAAKSEAIARASSSPRSARTGASDGK